MFLKSTLTAATGAILLALAAPEARAATLVVAPTAPGPFEIGDSIVFGVTTSSDFATLGAVAFELILTYDAGDLSFASAEALPPIAELAAPSAPVSPSGLTTLDDLSGGLFSGVFGDNQLIATFAFTALGSGVATVDIASTFINGSLPVPAEVFTGTVSGSATINGGEAVVPLPAPAILLLTALGAFPMLRLRRFRMARARV